MRRDVVVVGASAGGVEALRAVVGGLDPEFSGTILVVLHVPAFGGSVLPAILSRAGALPARHGLVDEPLPTGEVVIAPPDHHLVVHDSHLRLTKGPARTATGQPWTSCSDQRRGQWVRAR